MSMSVQQDVAMEFVAQEQQAGQRMCGAAALAMVYRSFGWHIAQADIWPRIARRDDQGSWNAATYLLARDAMARSLDAIVVQASRAWETLVETATSPWRAILNHRYAPASPSGHFSVLLAADDQRAVIHDPEFGPRRQLLRDQLLELWRPGASFGEVTGYVLVAIGRAESRPEICDACGEELPLERWCSACSATLRFPKAVLGCTRSGCRARRWARVFCPCCDASATEIVGFPAEFVLQESAR